jgi:hypothetical protein
MNWFLLVLNIRHQVFTDIVAADAIFFMNVVLNKVFWLMMHVSKVKLIFTTFRNDGKTVKELSSSAPAHLQLKTMAANVLNQQINCP